MSFLSRVIVKGMHIQMKGRWESNINVCFPVMYSQKRNSYFQNRIVMFCLPVPTLIYLWEVWYFQDRSAYSAAGIYVDQSGEYMYGRNRSQTQECGNWDWGRAIPRKGIHTGDFRCSEYRNMKLSSGGIHEPLFDKRLESFVLCYSQSLLLADFTHFYGFLRLEFST